MKHKVAIGRLAVSGTERAEIGTWLVEVVSVSITDPEVKRIVEDVVHIPVSQVPTDVARNKLVKACQQNDIDILFMVDDDASPPESWFKTALQFLVKQKQPAVIGCPYVCGGINQEVQVFRFASPGNHPQQSFTLSHYPREEAARKTGIEQVPNIGTHCVAYDMRVFEALDTPYYAYTLNEDHTGVIETEDTNCHRKLYFKGVPIFVSWDHWAIHWKLAGHDRPFVVERKDIDACYIAQAKAVVATEVK